MVLDEMKLTLHNVSYQGELLIRDKPRPYVHFNQLNHELTFGKVYHIACERDWDALGYNRLISGIITPQTGEISIDGVVCNPKKLRRISWHLRYEEIRRWGIFRQNIKNQIRQNKKKGNRYPLSENDYIRHFLLTPSRYLRYITQVSSEAWRASCAIGMANDRQIFCFPAVEHWRRMSGVSSGFIQDYGELWLFDMLALMKPFNCLILLPLPPDTESSHFCDEIIMI